MNCVNHPETPVASYCQFCGKPLCALCAHKINNIVSCEPCLAARVQAAAGAAYGVPVNDATGHPYTSAGPLPSGSVPPSWGTEPWIAFILGWIPGVGAMYNGQFAKALAHVIIFALLVDFSHYNGVLGLMVAAWIFYQVFDAYQTAIARRDGLPLPNPLGLNDVAQWFSARAIPIPPAQNPWVGYAGNPNATNQNTDPANPGGPPAGTVGVPPGEFIPPYGAPPVPPVHPSPVDPTGQYWRNHGIPTGALVLIILGIAFLLGNLGILSDHWLGRGWPILLIALGIWLVIQRSQMPPAGGVR
ncbi:MAG TPA: DUF5668 domain-containing protein [Acidobacteriaceae bacterium]|nr:DUF5668 domain-containing protein [Terriglobia bacterium]HVC91996.1 DUF5668 domain-containing protein [Acidobacteriaceae bacterium]